jgi:hypothetical protein
VRGAESGSEESSGSSSGELTPTGPHHPAGPRHAFAGPSNVGAVTARTPSQQAGSDPDRAGRVPATAGWAGLPPRLRSALGVSLAGGVALAVGPLLPVVSPATAAGFDSGPLLFVTGLLPVAVALAFALRGRTLAAGGALIVAALFAPGRAFADAQLAADSTQTSRPELAVSHVLDALHGSIGLWLLLLGHLLTLLGGLLAVGYGGQVERATQIVDAPPAAAPGSRQGPVILGLCLGVLAAVGLLAAPFTSADPYLVAHDVLDSPPWQLAGGLLIAIVVPVVSTAAMAVIDPVAVRGWLFGAAAVVAAVALPAMLSGLLVPGLEPSAGPYVALIGALALVGIALPARPGAALAATDDAADEEPAELTLPGPRRMHRLAGIAGLIAAIAAVLGATTSLYVLPADIPPTASYAGRLLLPAGLLIGVLGAAMLVPRWASLVRPALAVAWTAVLLAGLDAVDTTLAAVQINGVGVGFGSWATVVAIVAALVAACCAGVAGGVERDDVDLTEVRAKFTAAGPIAAGVLLAIGAFGLPVLRAPDYLEPGLWSNFRVESWGLLIGLIAVVGAALLATVSRPNRGAALLVGAAGVLLVRALELPLTSARAADSTAGPGEWLALAAAVALVVAAGWLGMVGRRNTPPPTRRRPTTPTRATRR